MNQVPPSAEQRTRAPLCRGCGKQPPEDAPQGLCPSCLMRLAWDAGTPEEADDDVCTGEAEGALPRVLTSQGKAPAGQAATLPTTTDAGRYVGFELHAWGGIGEVFTATDTELHRVVALKRLQGRHADHAPSQRRFLLEAEITARLEHPGVVPVHSLFRDEVGRPCYSMRFIEGRTLADALSAYHAGATEPVAFRRLLQNFIQVCETIAYAHSRGIIHRDLKPQNVMLGKFGETIVVDWGLAKVVGRTAERESANPEATLRPMGDSSGDETQMGIAVGTPVYMSPEQAAGRWDVINSSSDVYSLGGVLYALLTGRAPLEGGNWPELQQKIQRGDFPRPSAVNPAVPRALEAICLKAMALKPEDRYPSARALAAEVELWLADEPVQAYREPTSERLGRWARRRKALIAYGISGFIALVTLVASVWAISLEKAYSIELEKARNKYVLATQHIATRNARVLGELALRHDQFDSKASGTMDWMARQLSQDSRWNNPEFQPLRKQLLQEVLEFWDEAIEIDTNPARPPGWRARRKQLVQETLKGWNKAMEDEFWEEEKDLRPQRTSFWRALFYHRQRALCLARLGEHERASLEAEELRNKVKNLSGEVAYDLARVYGVCAAAVKDNRRLAERYAGRAVVFLHAAAKEGYFAEAVPARVGVFGASTVVMLSSSPGLGPLLLVSTLFPGRASRVEHLYDDPDLAPLRQRQDFRELLREVQALPD